MVDEIGERLHVALPLSDTLEHLRNGKLIDNLWNTNRSGWLTFY